MVKYAHNIDRLQPKVNPVPGTIEGIGKIFESENQRYQSEKLQKMLADPNVPDIQKAIALASVNKDLASQYIKGTQRTQAIGDIEAGIRRRLGQESVEEPIQGKQQQQQAPQIPLPGPLGLTANAYNAPQLPQGGMAQQTLEQMPVRGEQSPQQVPQGTQLPPGQEQVPQEDPRLKEIEAYDVAASQAAQIGDPTLAADYRNKANQIRKDIRADKQTEVKLQSEAIRTERENNKDAAPFIKDTINAYKGALEEGAVIGQMEQLVKKGNLITPALNKLMNLAGVPLGTLENPEVEAFDKLSNSLTRGISKYFPGRINVIEFQNFLRQIPTLQNSDEGKLWVIENLRKLQEPKIAEYRVLSEILRENGNKAPANLNFLVTERMGPFMDSWAKEMTAGIERANSIATGQPSGTIRMTRNGKTYDIPRDKVESAREAGFQ